jgi:GT2 family glycosyltransferase
MIKVFMGIPSTGDRADLQCYALREIEALYKDKVQFVYPKVCTFRKFHDFARNAVVEEFLATDCDVLWFLDSDIVPPNNIGDLLTTYLDQWEVAGAPYPVWMQPDGAQGQQVVFCVYTRGQAGGLHAQNCPTEGLAMVDGLATGCMFIKREIFSKLEKPYFEFKFAPATRQMTEGEDLGFCLKVNNLGHKFFVDFSTVCRHYKTVDLTEVNNYAITYANKAVLAYDAQIKPKIVNLANEVQEYRRAAKARSSLILPT